MVLFIEFEQTLSPVKIQVIKSSCLELESPSHSTHGQWDSRYLSKSQLFYLKNKLITSFHKIGIKSK